MGTQFRPLPVLLHLFVPAGIEASSPVINLNLGAPLFELAFSRAKSIFGRQHIAPEDAMRADHTQLRLTICYERMIIFLELNCTRAASEREGEFNSRP